MHARISQAGEDYLKAIYEITRDGDRASTNEIAEQMGVTPASATGMIQKLAGEQPPLLEYEKRRGAALTQEGKQIALEIIRHHRLLETFLHEKLGYSWDEVHEEAERLEHVISEELEERIARVLNNPRTDPHGDPIPTSEFQMPERSQIRLDHLQAGDRASVVQIKSNNPELLRYLASIGLTLNCMITVTDVSPFDGNTYLQVDGTNRSLVLGPRVTEAIFVESIYSDALP